MKKASEVLKQRRKMRHGMKVYMSCWRVSSKYLKDPKAKDALKEATKEAAKKRKKEMQTEEDGKTSSFESEVNPIGCFLKWWYPKMDGL